MSFPVRWWLPVQRWSAGPVDGYNNASDVWAADTIGAHGLTVATEETQTAQRQSDTSVLTVYAQRGVVLGARDRISWAGHTYEVQGDSVDWGTGPWPSDAGVVIRARRVDG